MSSATLKAQAIRYWWTKAKSLSAAYREMAAGDYRGRQKGDYVAFAEFDQTCVEKQLQGCEAFLKNFVLC